MRRLLIAMSVVAFAAVACAPVDAQSPPSTATKVIAQGTFTPTGDEPVAITVSPLDVSAYSELAITVTPPAGRFHSCSLDVAEPVGAGAAWARRGSTLSGGGGGETVGSQSFFESGPSVQDLQRGPLIIDFPVSKLVLLGETQPGLLCHYLVLGR